MQRVIQENQHDVFVISPDMMDEIVAIQAQQGNTQAQTIWEQIRGTVEFGANYFALTGDITKLAQLGYALGGLGQAYVKSYNGKSYIILKGRAGLRRILTGTRYLVNNTKVIALGLGKHAAQAAARSGGILTLYLVGAYRVTDFFLRDEATLTQLIGHLAVDVVKVAITVGAAYLASAAVAAAVGIAVGPIAAVVLVGIVLTPALNSLDEYYGISEKVVQGLEELTLQSQSYLQQIRRNVREKATQTASRAAKPVLDYIVDSVRRTAIDAAKHRLERFINPRFY